MELSSILRRIQKLLAIANDGRGDPNEAAAAAAQAENLMRKFNIDNADLLTKQYRAGEIAMATAMCYPSVQRIRLTRCPLWSGWLAIRIAQLYGAEVRYAYDSEKGAAVQFCGQEADVQVCAWTFDYVLNCLIVALRTYQKRAQRTKAESASYIKGFVLAVCTSLRGLADEQRKEMQTTVSSRALVESKSAAIAAHFGKFNYGKGKNVNISEQHAAAAGHAAGAKVDVSRRGLGATQTNGPLAIAA